MLCNNCDRLGEKTVRKTALQIPRSVKTERWRCSKCWSRHSLQPVVNSFAAYGRSHSTRGGHVLKEAAACGEPTLQLTNGRSCSSCGTHHISLSMKDSTLQREPKLEQLFKNCSLARTHTGAILEGPYSLVLHARPVQSGTREVWQSEIDINRPQLPFYILLCCSGWGEGRRLGSEAEPVKKVRLRKVYLVLSMFWTILLQLAINKSSLSWVCFTHNGKEIRYATE